MKKNPSKIELVDIGASSRFKWSGMFPIVFLLFWSSITGIADYAIFSGIYRQMMTYTYAETIGEVIQSKVIVNEDSDGNTYEPEITYKYSLDGGDFENSQYRHATFSTSSDSLAKEAVARYPVGRQVTVYYKPSDAAVSTLERGLNSHDLMIPLFLMPFNSVMIVGWLYILGSITSGFSQAKKVGTCTIREDGLTQRLRIPSMSPLVPAIITAGACGFVLIFPLAFLTNLNPPMAVAIGAWAMVIVASGLAYAVCRINLAMGNGELVIDRMKETLRVPAARLLRAPITIRIGQIVGMDIYEYHNGMQVNNEYKKELRLYYNGFEGEQMAPLVHAYNDISIIHSAAYWIGSELNVDFMESEG